MAATGYDRAVKLADGALKGFKTAHAQLTSANTILAQEAAMRLREAEARRKELERMASQAEAHAASCQAMQTRNQRTIDKLADLLG